MVLELLAVNSGILAEVVLRVICNLRIYTTCAISLLSYLFCSIEFDTDALLLYFYAVCRVD